MKRKTVPLLEGMTTIRHLANTFAPGDLPSKDQLKFLKPTLVAKPTYTTRDQEQRQTFLDTPNKTSAPIIDIAHLFN